MAKLIDAIKKGFLIVGVVTLIIGAGGWANHRQDSIYMMTTAAIMIIISLVLFYIDKKKKQ